MNTKTLYLIKRIAFVALFAMGFLLLPNTGAVLAQKGDVKEVATTEMISYALDLRSVTDMAVYADKAVSDKGDSAIANGYRRNGVEKDDANRKDLAKSFSAINQLPCTEIADTDLSGKTFGAGVYCLASAELSSRLILDGENNSNAVFIFRIAGALNAKSGSSIGLVNDAQASSVFFVSDDSATVGEGADFKGNIIARNDIGVGANAMVDGRVLSVKGNVALSGNSILGPQQTGVLEICKAIAINSGAGLTNRIFRFRVGALIVEVPAGQCSGPITVPTGLLSIEELLDGRLTTGGTFTGNFQVTDVRQLVNTGQAVTNSLVSANLPLRIANLNIPGPLGDISSQTTIQFTNQFAITGVLEICKEGIDTGVTGFFNFTVDGLRQGLTTGSSGGVLGTAAPLVNFVVPVGQCTNAISIPVSSDINSGPPRVGTATIRELPRTGFIFTSATTALGTAGGGLLNINRLVGFNALANGGGDATVRIVAGNDGGNGTNVGGAGGATSVQTTVFFNNRTAPGQLKVCKIAGPGVRELTSFTFEVFGIAPFDPVVVDTTVAVNNDPVFTSGIPTTQNLSQGIARVGATLQGGNLVRREVTVLAGPASNPGGFCQFVNGTFVVDTLAFVRETGPTATTIISSDGGSTGVIGTVRVSRVRSSTGIISLLGPGSATPTQAGLTGPIRLPLPPTAAPANAAVFPTGGGFNTGNTTGVLVPIRRGVTEVEFVNVAFSPVPLKICKIAGTGIVPNTTSFTFTVTQDTAGGLLAPFSSTVTVTAGPRAVNPGDQNGNCDFVSGPFINPTTNALGSFNFNSTVTITENAMPGFVVAPNGISSPTGGIIANVSNRTAFISRLGNGVNEVQFINQSATAPTIEKSRKRARFF